MNNDVKQRQALCAQLHRAGMAMDISKVAKLLAQLHLIDQEMEVPKFDLPEAVPNVGDLVYLPTRMSIDHGYDDVAGGVGVVREVKQGISCGKTVAFVATHEHPGRSYNWKLMSLDQSSHKKNYGGRWARPDPDL